MGVEPIDDTARCPPACFEDHQPQTIFTDWHREYSLHPIVPNREVPGASSRADEPSPVTACEVFGEALERFSREKFQGRGIGRELGELSEKARLCFRALAPESEQLERVRDEGIRLGRKKAVNA
jgi:GNAT superfamily N-acetyltransferase